MAIPVRAPSDAANSRSTGVILAIDYGKKRLGLALSDEFRSISRPYATWTRTNRRRDLARLRELIREQKISQIVVGLPLHLDGTPSEMSEEANRFAARAAKALGIPVEMIDERLTSWDAHETMAARSTGKPGRLTAGAGSGKKSDLPLDEIAAAIILRDYLDLLRKPGRSGSRV